jgi:hypothetical protein
MAPDVLVVINPWDKAASQGRAVFKRLQIKILILDGSAKALDANVVLTSAATFHTDFNPVFFENPGKNLIGILTALVGIEDVRPSISTQGFL